MSILDAAKASAIDVNGARIHVRAAAPEGGEVLPPPPAGRGSRHASLLKPMIEGVAYNIAFVPLPGAAHSAGS